MIHQRLVRIGVILLLLSAVGCGLGDKLKSKVSGKDLDELSNLNAPTVNAIADQAVVEGAAIPPVGFTISDEKIPADKLNVTATSSNPTLLPNSGLTLGGSGANRTVSIQPASSQAGVATIKVTVSNGLLTKDASFTLTVRPLTNLEVPIEMLMAGVSSKPSPQIFHSTRTSLDPSDYDGTVRYFFEITATNGSLTTYPVELVNTGNIAVASLGIPSLSLSPVRHRVEFTPNVGASTYRIKLPATSSANTLKVFLARILVQQTSATKTKVFIPLLSSNYQSTTNNDKLAGSLYTSANYQPANQNANRALWGKNSSNWSTLATASPFTLEAVLYNNNTPGTSKVALFDKSAGLIVADSEISSSGVSDPTLFTKSFSDSATNFTNLHDFELRGQDGNSNLRVARAGLWVKLESLFKGEVSYLATRSFSSDGVAGYQRALIDTSLFSNPSVLLEASGYREFSSPHLVELRNHGVNDTASGGTSAINGSMITLDADGNSNEISRARSAALSGITSGDRYLVQSTHDGVTTLGLVVVGFSR